MVARVNLKSKGHHFASLIFSRPGLAPAPPKAVQQLGKQHYFLYYDADEYPRVVDLLRHESPISLYFDGTVAYLQSGAEPVGEHES